MQNQVSFIVKLLVISTGLSIFIKYGGYSLNLAATSANAIALVLLPTLILAIALWWRAYFQRKDSAI